MEPLSQGPNISAPAPSNSTTQTPMPHPMPSPTVASGLDTKVPLGIAIITVLLIYGSAEYLYYIYTDSAKLAYRLMGVAALINIFIAVGIIRLSNLARQALLLLVVASIILQTILVAQYYGLNKRVEQSSARYYQTISQSSKTASASQQKAINDLNKLMQTNKARLDKASRSFYIRHAIAIGVLAIAFLYLLKPSVKQKFS